MSDEYQYQIDKIGTLDRLLSLQTPWGELLSEVEGASVFLTWDWVTTWWRHFGSDRSLFVLTATDASGRLAGIAPWMMRRHHIGPLVVKQVSFIGDGIVSPAHMDIIARPEHSDAIARTFLARMLANGKEWDVLDFLSLSQFSALRARLMNGEGKILCKDILDCWCIPLPATWDLYMAQHMNHKQRRNYRYHYRRLDKEHPGEVEYQRVTDEDGIAATLDSLGSMQRQRLAERGLVSPFANPSYIAFHKDMAALANRNGWLRLFRLMVGGQVVAVFYLYRRLRDYYGYQMSFDRDWNKYSPGVLLLAYVMQEAIREEATSLDLSYGAEGYKDDWGECSQIDSHLLYSHNLRGNLWLLGAKFVDHSILLGRRFLSEDIRNRGNCILAGVRRWPVFQR